MLYGEIEMVSTKWKQILFHISCNAIEQSEPVGTWPNGQHTSVQGESDIVNKEKTKLLR